MVSIPAATGTLSPGAGVRIATIERMRDAFVDTQIRRTLADLGRWEARGQVLEEVQEIFKEPSDIGLSAMMDHFWISWHELSASATDPGRRNGVQQEGVSLAAAFNLASSQLNDMKAEVDSNIISILDRVKVTAQNIAAINTEIVRGNVAGENVSDLQDHRDLLIDQLAADIDIAVVEVDDGTVNISVGGRMLVSAGVGFEVDVNSPFTGGRIKGLLEASGELIPEYMRQLDELAVSVMNEVNHIHENGRDLHGNLGGKYFEGSGALDMRVADGIMADPSRIAASDAVNAPGNGKNALAIAQLKDALTMTGGSATFRDFYGGVATGLGLRTQEAMRSQDVYEGVLEQQEARRDSISGVSIDEEIMQLIKYQAAYSAAARLVNVIDEMLDRLINQTGLVGR